MNNFESKVVIVTGGAGGIGKATCEAFINSKATVLCVDNNKERIEKFKSSYLLKKLSASKKVPFLLIWGDKDNFIPLFVGKKIANFHRWVKLKIVSNSGHCIHDEDPSVFNRISFEWIRDLKTF